MDDDGTMAHSPEASTYRDSIESEASGPAAHVVADEALGAQLTQEVDQEEEEEERVSLVTGAGHGAAGDGTPPPLDNARTGKNRPESEQGDGGEVTPTMATLTNNRITVEVDEEEELINELPPDELCIIETSPVLELPLDEIPEPIKVLDDIISEFEDASKPLLLLAANGENQSEDDGYMSLSRKNLPKKDSEELSQNSLDSATTPTSANSANIGGSNTAMEAVGQRCSDELLLLPQAVPLPASHEEDGALDGEEEVVDDANDRLPLKKRKERVGIAAVGGAEVTVAAGTAPKGVPEAGELVQTTLPKMRPSVGNTTAGGAGGGAGGVTAVGVTHKNYSSLPCCGAGRAAAAATAAAGSGCHALGGAAGGGPGGGVALRSAGSYNGERLVLGIDISAVHNAVLRGGLAKLPEPILNEHPVTIYPGPPSAAHGKQQPHQRSHHHRNNKAAVEKHKEMCHILNPLTSLHLPPMSSSTSSSNSTSSSSSSSSSASSTAASHSNSSSTSPEASARRADQQSHQIGGRCGGGGGIRGGSDKQQVKPNAVAWEIHFDNEPPQPAVAHHKTAAARQRTPVKTPVKMPVKTPVKIPQKTPVKTPVKTPKRFGGTGSGGAKKIQPPMLFNDFVHAPPTHSHGRSHKDDLASPSGLHGGMPPPPILNHHAYNDGDMLGKGTFIIRRNGAGKKVVPRAADLFQAPPPALAAAHSRDTADSAEEEEDAEDEDDSLPPPPPLEVIMAANHIHGVGSNNRGRQSDREKLSLNFEVAAIAKSLSPLGTGVALSQEPTSTDDSLNEKSSSLEEEEYEDDATLGQAYDVYDFAGVPPPPLVAAATAHGIIVSPTSHAASCSALTNGSHGGLGGATTGSTPRTDLAPTLEEEDEEQYSDFSYGGGVKAAVSGSAPLKQIESNISALLRGDIAVARAAAAGLNPTATSPLGATAPSLPHPPPAALPTAANAAVAAAAAAKRALEFRPGVHKSESGKEMLLSQAQALGPLPPSPPSSSSDMFDYDDRLPPLPPLPPPSPAGALVAMGVLPPAAHPPPPPQPAGLLGHHGPHPQPPLPAPPVPPPSSSSASAPANSSFRRTASVEIHAPFTPRPEEKRDRQRGGGAVRHFTDDLPLPLPPTFEMPPAVPPHRSGGGGGPGGHSMNTIKSWSIDSNYKRRKSPRMGGGGGYMAAGGLGILTGGSTGGGGGGSGMTTPTGPPPPVPMYDGAYSTRRYVSYGGGMGVGHMGTATKQRSLRQSPREEHRLQTSCSLPETPIFARGCDIPRTPFRRQTESNTVGGGPGAPPVPGGGGGGSRTAPRSSTAHNINMGNSIVGIAGGSAFGTSVCRQRSINHALASNEMLRLSGAPGRGWYPKQRSMRPASTENIDRLASGSLGGGGGAGGLGGLGSSGGVGAGGGGGVSSSASSGRVWDSAAGMSGTGGHSRKPLTLPPNLTPSFLNKSPREALRRVTSLLITKKKGTKERRSKPYADPSAQCFGYDLEAEQAGKDAALRSSHKNNNADISAAPSTGGGGGGGVATTPKTKEKKKGLFKNLWKRSKQSVSTEQ